MSSCRGLPVWSLVLIQRQRRNESLFNLFFPIRPIWSLLAIVPETAGGVLNSENEIRWPTGKKTILARQQCLWLPFKIFRFFETTFARFFLKRISSFFHQIFIDRFSHKITFSKLAVYDRRKTEIFNFLRLLCK